MLTVEALRTPLIGPVSLSVAGGECLAITGPSGSGKSLLLRALADLDPNEGRAALGGAAREALSAPEWRRRVGLVPAESGWWADRVGDHFAPRPDPGPHLRALGLDPAAPDWPVHRLSSGERQRLALVRALQRAPRALLLDEPCAALDPAATEAVEALLRGFLAAGGALVLVTHDAGQAARMGHRRRVMRAGRLEPEAEAAGDAADRAAGSGAGGAG